MMNASSEVSPVDRMVTRPAVAARVQQLLSEIRDGHPTGGKTIGSKSASRVLVCWGSCPDGVDERIREMLAEFPDGYQVSIVRHPAQFERYTTL